MDFKTLTHREDIIALHEVGHFIVMYALGMYDTFKSISVIPGNGKEGLTDLTFTGLADFSPKFIELNSVAQDSAEDYDKLSDFWFVQASHSFFPHICRLFAGGSICRYYGISEENLCSIDHTLISQIMSIYGMGDENSVKQLQTVVDMFLKNVFLRYERLTQIVYSKLKAGKFIDKSAMDTIINIWKSTFKG